MGKGMFLVWCAGFSAVLGGTWGALISMIDVEAGLFVGTLLFLLGFKVMTRHANEVDEVVHDRRFNDSKGEL